MDVFSIIYDVHNHVVDTIEKGVYAVVFKGANKRLARTTLGPTQGAWSMSPDHQNVMDVQSDVHDCIVFVEATMNNKSS